ncbi:MAG TPA: YraN family protein [Bryobacteraceae bacterium]|nr:YraN family protein [Bryobacteraceae bacterium]
MLRWLYRFADRLRQGAADPGAAATGSHGEDLAHRHLQAHGYWVVARNYRPPSGRGEIDLVAWEGNTLVFVEVKTRSSEEFGTPDRAVDAEKERLLDGAGRDYARRAGVAADRLRFDLVNVVMSRPPRVQLLRDAFHLTQTI